MAIDLEINTKVNTDGAVQAIKALEKRIKNLEKLQEDAVEQQEDMAEAVKATEKNTGGLAKGFKGVGLAIKASGVGLVIGVLNEIKKLFMQNQKVADLFSTAFGALSKVVNDFVDFITTSGLTAVQEFFTDLIDNPMENIKALGRAIWDNIIERLRSAIEVFGFAGQAIKKLFQRDWDGAMEAARQAGKELVDVYTGVDNTTEKVSKAFDKASKAVTGYAKETWDAAAAATELNNQSQLAEARQQLLIEKYDREAEVQREIRDNINKTFEERLAAANKLGVILDQQTKAELELVRIKLQQAEANVAISNSVENQTALIQAQAAEQELLARITGFRTEQQEQLRALEKEIADEKEQQIELAKKRQEELDLLVQKSKENDISQQIDLLSKVEEIENEYLNKSLARQDVEKNAVIDKYFQIIEAAKRAGQDITTLEAAQAAELSDIDKKYAKKEADDLKSVEEKKIAIAKNAANALSSLMEEGSAEAKAIATAQVLFDTFRGIQAAFASNAGNAGATIATGGAWPFIQAATAAAFGFANLAAIHAAPTKAGSGGGGSAPSVSVPTAPSDDFQTPEFGFLNQGVGGTQGADFGASRSYVVLQDIRDKESLDERIRDSSRLG